MAASKMAYGLVPSCGAGRATRSKQNFEQLKLKKNILQHLRGAIEEEMMKELFQEMMTLRDLRKSMAKLDEVERQLDYVINHKKSFSRERLQNLTKELDLIFKYFGWSSLDHGLRFDSLHERTMHPAKAFGRAAHHTVKPEKKEATTWMKKAKATEEVGGTTPKSMGVAFPKQSETAMENKKTSAVIDYTVVKSRASSSEELGSSSIPALALAQGTEVSPPHEHDIDASVSRERRSSSFQESEIVELAPQRRRKPRDSYLMRTKSSANTTVTEESGSDYTGESVGGSTGTSGPEPTPFLDPKPVQLFLPKTVQTTECNLPEVTFNSGSSREGTTMPLTVPSLEGFDKFVDGNGKFATGEIEESSYTKLKTPKSIQHTVEKILGYIEDANTKTIGVSGRDGIGKTSAVKVLVDHLESKGMFDVVLWVTVSGVWSVRGIQDELFKQLGLHREASMKDSNICIESTLQQMKFLLILDDVRQMIDFDKVGIPSPSTENNCKLIMITESVSVFSTMDARVQVEALSFEEACELFYEKVGSVINLPDIKPYVGGIVQQCRGLPLLIIGTGWALAEENDAEVWACAFKEFQFQKKVGAQQLKFIYDRLKAYCAKFHRLKTSNIQGCFLYCALLSRDHEVRTSKLVECWMQEGLIAGDAVDAVKRGHEIVNVLVVAALLECDKDGLFIRMHKLVRDFALEMLLNGAETHPNSVMPDFKFIQPTSDESRPIDHYLLKAGGRLVEAPPAEEWKQAKTIFLMDNEFSSLPERPKCPYLSELFLQRNHRLTAIPSSFFDYMPNLEVLDLSKTSINLIPISISKLKNLRELIMKDCGQIVKLPSEVGKVRFLEVLDLHGTMIEQLPVKTGELATLRCMRVCFHRPDDDVMSSKSPITLLSHGFLTRLLSLRSLSIVVVPGDRRWNNLVEDIVRDMRKLRNLAELRFYFPKVHLLQNFLETCPSWKRNVLKRFNFVVGHDVKRMMSRVPYDVEVEYNKRDRCMRFVNSNSETVPEVVSQLLSRATAFYLDHDLKIQSLSGFGTGNIAHLEFCVVRECPKLERIIDGADLEFPLLEQLSIHYSKSLKCIWSGNLQTGSFACLKHLCLRTCGSLEFVMTRSMTQYVSNLEELVVEDCEIMTELVKEDEESLVRECEIRPELEKKDEDEIVMCGHTVLPRLKCLTLHYLPTLFSIWKGPWPALQYISFYNCPNLRNLHMDHNSEIRRSIVKIEAENEWWSRLVWEDASLSRELDACFIPFGEEFP